MSEDVVWVDVLPAMDKFGGALSQGADQAAAGAGKSAGGKFGLAAMAGVTAVAGGAVIAAKALYGIGETFDEVTDTIRAGTGATGDDLDSLVASVKNVGSQVPAEFEAIGTVVADVNTRLGLTGDTLETFASQALEAGRVMGEEIDINAVSGAFSAFRIEGEDTIDAMDHLFRVSQATGVGMNELANNASRSAPAMQALGFSFEETTALVGNLDKAGLDSSKMMAGMSKALVELAKDGEEPQEAFKRVTGEIQGFMAEGDKASAIDLASSLFGTRNASQFIGALESGALNMEALSDVAGMTEDTILGVGEETMDFSEHWQIFGNQMSTLVAPIAEKVFGLISQGMQWINDNAIPWIDRMTESWNNSEGSMGQIRDVFERVWAFLKDSLVPIFMTFVDYIQQNVIPFVERLVGVVKDTMLPIFNDVWAMFRDKVIPILKNVADFIVQRVVPVIEDFANRVVLPLMKLVGDAIKGMWDNFAKPALEALAGFLKDHVGPAIEWLWEKAVSPTFKLMGDAIDWFGRNWESVWHNIQSAAAKPVNFVIETVWNNGLRKALNLIPGVDLAEANTVKVPPARSAGGGRGSSGGPTAAAAMAGGGILPGFSRYADGDDQLVWMRRGEGVTVTEALDDYERARLLRLNKAVLGGMSPARFRDQFDAHAGGGIVGYKGHRFTDVFKAALMAAEAMSGASFRISQGGFRPRTSYSGTSHQGDAVDIMSPITTAVITALRASGVAAWDRTGKGNWAPHIHGVPLPGFGRAAGSAVWQAQDYLRGGDGLGGRDNGPNVPAGSGGLFELPQMIADVIDSVKKGIESPWWDTIKDGMLEVVLKAKDWAIGKLGALGSGLDDLVFGENSAKNRSKAAEARGYATGTGYAAPGLAWVGERGPELVRFRGGEQVYSAAESSAMARQTTARLDPADIDRLAHAIVGVAQGISSRTVDSAFLALGRGV